MHKKNWTLRNWMKNGFLCCQDGFWRDGFEMCVPVVWFHLCERVSLVPRNWWMKQSSDLTRNANLSSFICLCFHLKWLDKSRLKMKKKRIKLDLYKSTVVLQFDRFSFGKFKGYMNTVDWFQSTSKHTMEIEKVSLQQTGSYLDLLNLMV